MLVIITKNGNLPSLSNFKKSAINLYREIFPRPESNKKMTKTKLKNNKKGIISRFNDWFIHDFLGIAKEMRLSYLPPLMIFFAAGLAGFTDIVESFFIKDSLGLSAAFLASLAFWAGLPWFLKMPLGHLVDIFWHRKAWFVYSGAALMAFSFLIMIGLTGYPEEMKNYLTLEVWYIISTMLSAIGFVMQNVVADAMTVEAVPNFHPDGSPVAKQDLQRMHTTMQTLGRIATVGGAAIVAGAGGWLANFLSFKTIYEISLFVPLISVSGVILGEMILRNRRRRLLEQGFSKPEIDKMMSTEVETTQINRKLLIGSAILILLVITLGISKIPFKEAAVFFLSLGLIIYLIALILKDTPKNKRWEIISIAAIVFVFRVTPDFGAGATWWQIDVLHFNEAFFGTLRQTSAVLAVLGMLALRGWMSKRPISYLIVFLTIYSTFLILPFIGLYYGLGQWTLVHFHFGARSIALVDTAASSPLEEVAMIPMLTWIAKEAPRHEKATYFAVFAAFTNIAISGSSLFTQYINDIFVVGRGQYGQLGILMITVTFIGLVLPIATVIIFNSQKLRKIFQNLFAK